MIKIKNNKILMYRLHAKITIPI